MNGTAIAYALQLLTQLPALIQAGTDVIDAINEGRSKLEEFQSQGRDPTPQEWQELNDRIDSLRADLHSDNT